MANLVEKLEWVLYGASGAVLAAGEPFAALCVLALAAGVSATRASLS